MREVVWSKGKNMCGKILTVSLTTILVANYLQRFGVLHIK